MSYEEIKDKIKKILILKENDKPSDDELCMMLENKFFEINVTAKTDRVALEKLRNEKKLILRETLLQERKSLLDVLSPYRKGFLGTTMIVAVLLIIMKFQLVLRGLSFILNEQFSIIAFYILLYSLILLSLFYSYFLIKKEIIKTITLKVSSVYLLRNFSAGKTIFSESDVISFFKVDFKKNRYFLFHCEKVLFSIYKDGYLEVYKNIFIMELLNKDAVVLSSINGLERTFKIITSEFKNDNK